MKLNINHLSKYYDSQMVLDEITLNLENIKSIGVIGESGCGKSTFLKCLAGIESIDNGVININELSLNKQKIEVQKQLGFVFQKHHLFPHLSLKENCALILRKTKKIDHKLADEESLNALRRLHIENEANKRPNQVSGGQAQRAAIARALVTKPKMLFLDEPTASLDPILTMEVLNSVTELKNQGIDFIFVTHEIKFLEEFADYILFFKDGKIHEHGNVSCLKAPKTKELEMFLLR